MKIEKIWFLEPAIDFEMKNYQLMAYQKRLHKALSALEMYPHFGELQQHIQTLELIFARNQELENSLRKTLIGIDEKKWILQFENGIEKNQIFTELLDILKYIHQNLKISNSLFEEELNTIKNKMDVDIVGILPSYKKEGFLILDQPSGYYLFSYFQNSLRSLSGDFTYQIEELEKYRHGFIHTPNSIKREVVYQFKETQPNPAVFICRTEIELPIYETMLPLSFMELNPYLTE